MKTIYLFSKVFSLQMLFLFFLITNESAIQAQSTWKLGAGGAWGTASNWTPDGVPDGVGAVVNITNDPTANAGINLGGTRTIGKMNIGHQEAWYPHSFSSGTLTFQAASGNAELNLTPTKIGDFHIVFGCTIQLNSNLDINFSGEGGEILFSDISSISGPTRTLTLKSNATFTHGMEPVCTFHSLNVNKLIVDGIINFNTNNNPSGRSEIIFDNVRSSFLADAITLKNGGNLRTGDSGSLKIHANTGIRIGAGGGRLTAAAADRHWVINSVISGTEGGSLTIGLGPGNVTLNAANTYNGPTILRGGNGTLILGHKNALPSSTMLIIWDSPSNNIAAAGKINTNGHTVTVGTLFLGGVQQPVGTYGSTTSTATYKNNKYFTGDGVINVTSAAAPSSYMILYEVSMWKPRHGVPMPTNQSKNHGASIKLANPPAGTYSKGFDKDYVFDNKWTTSPVPGSTGKEYKLGATFNEDQHLRLYPKLKKVNMYAVFFDTNGATGGSYPEAQQKQKGVPLTLVKNNGKFLRTDHAFAGWNTAKDGSGTNYPDGGTLNQDATVTLYAKWSPITALPSTTSANKISIYPSVTSDMIYLKDLPSDSRIMLVDMLGRNLILKNAAEVDEGLSLQPYANGLYIIKVLQGTEIIQSVKVLKK